MPIHDWQFWVATIVMLAAIWVLKIVLLPKKKGTKTTLTVGGKPVGKKSKPNSDDCGCS
ncbi:MAG: hypothetical protein P1U42_07870 [Phycisphaerales bacterium]|nr:hypothetical protein [Phycisphaerales bacterium]